MSRRARNNAKFAFYKAEMKNQTKMGEVGTTRWRKRNGYTVDEVRAMRAKYRRQVLAAGDGSVVPTPVKSDGFRNRRTRRTRTYSAGDKYDQKQVGTRLLRARDEKKALHLANPGDVRAELEYSIAKDEYDAHLAAVARYKIAEKIPAPAELPSETFSEVV